MSDKPVETCTVVITKSKRWGSSCPILVCTGPDQFERADAVVNKFRARPQDEKNWGDTYEAIDGVALDEV
jgi:hypothetical protein